MTKGTVSLQSATTVAKRISRETTNTIQVRQVSATGFGVFIPDLPKFKPDGILVGVYRDGKSVAV